MSAQDDLNLFLGLYKKNFGLQEGELLQFLNTFHQKYNNALEYLSKPSDDRSVSEVKRQIYLINQFWAWTNSIQDFKIKVNWGNLKEEEEEEEEQQDNNILSQLYQTLPLLIKKVAEIMNSLPINAPQRELFALLLQNLLPIYFVKAANITEIVTYLRQKLPNFVCVGYKPKDYPPMQKESTLDNSWEYSACRGFEASSDQNSKIHFLLLTFNPKDESVADPYHQQVNQERDEFITGLLPKLAVEQKDRYQQQSFFPNHQLGLNYALSSEPILLNGMKVIFDQSTPVYPVNLQPKDK
ncbi:MAG: hypothetical protein AB4063_01115 [Crocosphaera sp.]